VDAFAIQLLGFTVDRLRGTTLLAVRQDSRLQSGLLLWQSHSSSARDYDFRRKCQKQG